MQGDRILKRMFANGKGTSKFEDKLSNNGKPAREKIYVDSTLKTYRQGWLRFCDYLEKRGVKRCACADLEQYVQPFADWLSAGDYSAYTIHTWVSAVAKVLDLQVGDYQLPKRRRCDITRSRNPVKSDTRFSPANHQSLIDFWRSVGPRNHKELAYIRGTDLVEIEDGKFCVNIRKGKGGKPRLAPIYGPPARVNRVVEMMRKAGDQLLFEKIPTAADIHSYRAEYACTIYKTHARPIDGIPRNERYICRKDMAGTVYDKAAMMIASKALGHNRLDVIAQSYLWALDIVF